MTVTWPKTGRGPILDLTLPASADALDVDIRNQTTGKSMKLVLPYPYDGDDLTLDFSRRRVTDQDGIDRSSLISPSDKALWVPEPMIAGINDLEIRAQSRGIPGSSGPLNAATVANDAATGTVAWVNPTNAQGASNNTYASADLGSAIGRPSQYLKATAFGFALPAGATITGLLFEVERRDANMSSGVILDNIVRPVKAGAIQAVPSKAKTDYWPTGDTYASYGGSGDLWGTTWTQADVNNVGFGVAVSANHSGSASENEQALIDHIRATVYYLAAPSGSVAFGGTAALRWSKGYF